MLYGSHCYKLMYWGSSNSSTFSVYALCNRAEPAYEAEAVSLKTWILLWSVTHLNVQLFWTVTSSSGMHGSIKWRKHFKVLCNYYLYCLFPGNSTARTIKSWDNFMIITICVFGPSEALKPLPFFFRYICLGHLQSQAVIKVLLQSEFISTCGVLSYKWGIWIISPSPRLGDHHGRRDRKVGRARASSGQEGTTAPMNSQQLGLAAQDLHKIKSEGTYEPLLLTEELLSFNSIWGRESGFLSVCPLVGWLSSSGWLHSVVHG